MDIDNPSFEYIYIIEVNLNQYFLLGTCSALFIAFSENVQIDIPGGNPIHF